MDFLSTNSFAILEKSMGFLWTKQAAIADNVVNAETPNYKKKIVTFEDSIRAKIQAAAKGAQPRQAIRQIIQDTDFAVEESQDATRMDENGINTTDEMIEAVRNAYQLRYVYSAINSELSMLRTAVRGQ